MAWLLFYAIFIARGLLYTNEELEHPPRFSATPNARGPHHPPAGAAVHSGSMLSLLLADKIYFKLKYYDMVSESIPPESSGRRKS